MLCIVVAGVICALAIIALAAFRVAIPVPVPIAVPVTIAARPALPARRAAATAVVALLLT